MKTENKNHPLYSFPFKDEATILDLKKEKKKKQIIQTEPMLSINKQIKNTFPKRSDIFR